MKRTINTLLIMALAAFLSACGSDEEAAGAPVDAARSDQSGTGGGKPGGAAGDSSPAAGSEVARAGRPGAAGQRRGTGGEGRGDQGAKGPGRGPGDRAEMMKRFQNRPVPVAVASVERGRVDAFYSTTTALSAEEEAVVVARTQGVVEKIFVEEGDVVTTGTPLAQLDTRRLQLEVARTETNIKSLNRAFERAQQLMKTKMISPDSYDDAQFSLEREKATLALQLHDLEEATIRAPIDGRVTVRHIKLGNTLSPGGEAFEIKRSALIEAILNVPEKELPKMKVGQYARVSADALEGDLFDGVVDRIAPEVDASTGTFRVTVTILNEADRLKPGMFARVKVRFDSKEDALLLAREAVVVQKDESTVFVVRDGSARKQPVVTGYAMDNSIEILEGLNEGDEVVITGQGGLRDGASVRVVAM